MYWFTFFHMTVPDFRLRGKTLSFKMCPECDFRITEDIKNIILQCPLNTYFQDLRYIPNGSGNYKRRIVTQNILIDKNLFLSKCIP